ncbi:hypothetical protein AWENTII_002001 [Aspergillus wentii]
MATIFPLRWTYQVSLLIFLVGSVVSGAATSSKMFIIGRAISGMGGSGISTSGLSIVASVTPLPKRPLLSGLVLSMFGIGTVVAPILGGAITEKASWRWCFYINLPIGAVTIVALLLFMKNPQTKPGPSDGIPWYQKLDLIGCIIFLASVTMTLMALEWGGNQHAWDSSVIIGLFVGAGAGFGVFLAYEKHLGERAMIPFCHMVQRSTLLSIAYAFCLFATSVVPIYYLPEWFQVVQGVSPLESGVRMLPSVLSQVVGVGVSGGLAKMIRYYNPIFFAGSIMLATAVGLYTTFTVSSTPDSHWLGFQILQGMGVGLGSQMPLLMVQTILEPTPKHIPMGIALVMFGQFFGSSISQGISGSIFQNQLISQLENHAGLNPAQVHQLLSAGSSRLQQNAHNAFPQLVPLVLEAYNHAVTGVFWVPLTASIMGFIAALGIEWIQL